MRKIHRGEKQFKCSIFEKAFQRKAHLKRHATQVHERREYTSSKCGEKFSNMAPFRANQKSAHPKPSTSRKRPSEEESGGKCKNVFFM